MAGSRDQADQAGRSKDGPIFQDIARFRGILFDRMLRPHNLTMSQGWVVMHLIREDGLRQADLAERMNVATVTISKLIDRLVERGFVERKPDQSDRRTNRIFATPKARAMLRTMSEVQGKVDDIANAGIDTKDLAQTMRVLEQMRANLRTATGREGGPDTT
ncbi:MarR family winged helix-turn-helix transcriptional regulator [Aestuariivita boseongensis]|uniref:MarR family winged helix-turn-helix transcriptional regulator n=1 Tax=Aestuariivita boseongensis TaxID=1470562 RepID=UPI000682FCC0|nr:MarR family transcriptional regulator [Aestuariivita boseongensis]